MESTFDADMDPFNSDEEVDSDLEDFLYSQVHYSIELGSDSELVAKLEEEWHEKSDIIKPNDGVTNEDQNNDNESLKMSHHNNQQQKDDTDNWAIHKKDLMGIDKYRESFGSQKRYFTERPISTLFCRNCDRRGHFARDCMEPKKEDTCHVCGLRGHNRFSCPNSLCYNCYEVGHIAKLCQAGRKKNYAVCKRCWGRGHNKERCPEIWRQFHLTVKDSGPLQKPDVDKHGVIKSIRRARSCFNCGMKGHFGHDCKSDRPFRLIFHSPFVVHYDKCPSRSDKRNLGYTKASNRGNTPLDEGNCYHYADGGNRNSEFTATEALSKGKSTRAERSRIFFEDRGLASSNALSKSENQHRTNDLQSGKTGRVGLVSGNEKHKEDARSKISRKGESFDRPKVKEKVQQEQSIAGGIDSSKKMGDSLKRPKTFDKSLKDPNDTDKQGINVIHIASDSSENEGNAKREIIKIERKRSMDFLPDKKAAIVISDGGESNSCSGKRAPSELGNRYLGVGNAKEANAKWSTKQTGITDLYDNEDFISLSRDNGKRTHIRFHDDKQQDGDGDARMRAPKEVDDGNENEKNAVSQESMVKGKRMVLGSADHESRRRGETESPGSKESSIEGFAAFIDLDVYASNSDFSDVSGDELKDENTRSTKKGSSKGVKKEEHASFGLKKWVALGYPNDVSIDNSSKGKSGRGSHEGAPGGKLKEDKGKRGKDSVGHGDKKMVNIERENFQNQSQRDKGRRRGEKDSLDKETREKKQSGEHSASSLIPNKRGTKDSASSYKGSSINDRNKGRSPMKRQSETQLMTSNRQHEEEVGKGDKAPSDKSGSKNTDARTESGRRIHHVESPRDNRNERTGRGKTSVDRNRSDVTQRPGADDGNADRSHRQSVQDRGSETTKLLGSSNPEPLPLRSFLDKAANKLVEERVLIGRKPGSNERRTEQSSLHRQDKLAGKFQQLRSVVARNNGDISDDDMERDNENPEVYVDEDHSSTDGENFQFSNLLMNQDSPDSSSEEDLRSTINSMKSRKDSGMQFSTENSSFHRIVSSPMTGASDERTFMNSDIDAETSLTVDLTRYDPREYDEEAIATYGVSPPKGNKAVRPERGRKRRIDEATTDAITQPRMGAAKGSNNNMLSNDGSHRRHRPTKRRRVVATADDKYEDSHAWNILGGTSSSRSNSAELAPQKKKKNNKGNKKGKIKGKNQNGMERRVTHASEASLVRSAEHSNMAGKKRALNDNGGRRKVVNVNGGKFRSPHKLKQQEVRDDPARRKIQSKPSNTPPVTNGNKGKRKRNVNNFQRGFKISKVARNVVNKDFFPL